MELTKIGATGDLLAAGAVIKPSFCGPCFGAGDVPANNGLSIRHTTRNFPNREGSKPGEGQFAGVCLMDARSIAATAANGGRITPATDVDYAPVHHAYHYDSSAYDRRVYNGFGHPQPETELIMGPNITDWPAMYPMSDNLLVELRTKAAVQVTDNIPNIIYAFTVSPDEVVGRFEKNTAPVSARINAASKAIANGAKVRLCFDPIIKIPEWKEAYERLVTECAEQINFISLTDVSVGTFRISADYLNKMRRAYPDSKTAWYPYVIKDGVAQYEPETDKEMQEFVCALLEKHIGREKIFTWN